MSLRHPEFLFALAALLIPIIIHLFNFRRFKKVVFPNVRFLKEVELKTRSKNRLKHLLVLFSRIFALTCLVLAFTRPYLPADDEVAESTSNNVGMYIDNSFSMGMENEKGELLNQAKKIAESISKSFENDDRFMLLTNDLEAQHQRLVSLEEFQEYVSEIEMSSVHRDFSDIYDRASDIFSRSNEGTDRLYYLSDLQSNSFHPEDALADSLMTTRIVRLQNGGQGNVYIDSVWFSSPIRSVHVPERLSVRIKNASGKEIKDAPLRLRVNGIQKAVSNISLQPYSTADSTLIFSNDGVGWIEAEVDIQDYPITFDDKMYLAYNVREECNIQLIGAAADCAPVTKIFSNDDFFNVTRSDVQRLDISSLREQDLIVLCGVRSFSSGLVNELRESVVNGKSLVMIPSRDSDLQSTNELLLAIGANSMSTLKIKDTKVTRLETEHPLFNGVFEQIPRNMDFPSVKWYFPTNRRVRSSQSTVLSLQDGNPLLSSYKSGKGQSYVFTTGLTLDASTLSQHSVFVTSLLRMAESSSGNQQIYHVIGSDDPIEVPTSNKAKDAVAELKAAQGELSFIPEQMDRGWNKQYFVRGQISESGLFRLMEDDERIASVAFNYDRKESNMEFLDRAGAEERLGRTAEMNISFTDVSNLDESTIGSSTILGTQLWRWFIVLALIFLAIEVILLKFMKT